MLPTRKSGDKAKPKRKHYSVKPRALNAPMTDPAATAAPAPVDAVTIDGPVNLRSPLTLATWTSPLSSGLDFRLQLQLVAQVVPSSTTQASNQITIPPMPPKLPPIGFWKTRAKRYFYVVVYWSVRDC
jgi:hypothetical protein